jgi:hypothetical protein
VDEEEVDKIEEEMVDEIDDVDKAMDEREADKE